jgi:excisionase family DNA binding protein
MSGFINLKEAIEYLGISRVKLRKLIREGILTTVPDPLDSRARLVKKEDVEKLKVRD